MCGSSMHSRKSGHRPCPNSPERLVRRIAPFAWAQPECWATSAPPHVRQLPGSSACWRMNQVAYALRPAPRLAGLAKPPHPQIMQGISAESAKVRAATAGAIIWVQANSRPAMHLAKRLANEPDTGAKVAGLNALNRIGFDGENAPANPVGAGLKSPTCGRKPSAASSACAPTAGQPCRT